MKRQVQVCLLLAHSITCWSAETADERGPDIPLHIEEQVPGKLLYQNICASCHEHAGARVPSVDLLKAMSGSKIYNALTRGRMLTQAMNLSKDEIRAVSEYLSGAPLNITSSHPIKRCETSRNWLDRKKKSVRSGWGIDEENTRLVPRRQAALSAVAVKDLEVKWVFAFPNVSSAVAQPLIAKGGVFVGSEDGTLYALDAESGCVRWTFDARGEILGSVVMRENEPQSPVLLFSDRLAYTYAVDALSGALIWETRTDDHQSATSMGTPALFGSRLFVPNVSREEDADGPGYSCCTFRGSLVALDAATGNMIWKRYTIPSPAVEVSRNGLGQPQLAPSGAGIWSSPTIDKTRSQIYFATGNSYSAPADENSDAVFAIDLVTGAIKWRTQTEPGDNWTTWEYRCRSGGHWKPTTGCAPRGELGPDIDFTTSPVLVRGNAGNDVVVAGRKDGTTFGLDPDTGRIIWSTRTSSNPDPNAGALYFGLMVEGERVFVPSSGTTLPNGAAVVPTEDDGLYALDAFTGKRLWAARVRDDCYKSTPCTGISFAPIGFPGVVFAGATDGYVRAYETSTGKVLWRFDTAQRFTTVTGEMASGGALGRNSIMIGNGMVLVGSGYGAIPGNVLLAFAPSREPPFKSH